MGGSFFDGSPLGGGKFLFSFDVVDEFGHFLVVQAFLNKGIQITVAGRIEQAEPGKVTFGTELLRSGSKQ